MDRGHEQRLDEILVASLLGLCMTSALLREKREMTEVSCWILTAACVAFSMAVKQRHRFRFFAAKTEIKTGRTLGDHKGKKADP